MDSKKLAQLCRDLAENRKAEDVVVLDVRKLSTVTDYFVIATGSSEPHLRAIEDEILTRLLDDKRIKPVATEGSVKGAWLVMDFFDVIVHVMRKDVREKYDLEGLWGDATRVPRPRTRKKSAGTADEPAEEAADETAAE